MTEQYWTLPTKDGFKIYGILNTHAKKKNTKAIIHIHGLGGGGYDYAATRMALSFPKNGYDVIRPHLYWWQDGARNLVDCTIKTHANDIDLLFKHFKKKYKKIYVTGHSYGGPSLMTSNINQFAAVSLWDPTYIPAKSVGAWTGMKKLKDYFFMPGGSGTMIGKKMFDESLKYTKAYSIKLAGKCKAPLQVVYGDRNSFWLREGESFHTHAKGPTSEHIIKESQHCFYEEGSTEKLLRYTKKWFDTF